MIRRALWRLLLEQGGWSRIWYGLATAMVIAGGGLIYHQTNPGGGPASCASATANIPDGTDPWGGCWPGPSNTGPSVAQGSLPDYTGSCTITADNTTIDSVVIPRTTCNTLVVATGADNVTISNSYLYQGIVQEYGSNNLQIHDIYLDNARAYAACSGSTSCPAGDYACGDPNNGTTDCGVTGGKFDILRSEILNTNRATYCLAPDQDQHPGETGGPCLIQDNYFHGTNLWPDQTNQAHASSVRNEQYETIRHNILWCSYEGPFPNQEIGCSADLSGYPDFVPIMHDTIDRNMFMDNNDGQNYCGYFGGTSGKPYSNNSNNATYIVVTDNVFKYGANHNCGLNAPVVDFISGRTGNTWSGNKWEDGTTVPPDG